MVCSRLLNSNSWLSELLLWVRIFVPKFTLESLQYISNDRHGVCDHATGKCKCFPTWSGLDCAECGMPCPLDCSSDRDPPRGRCLKCLGRCECEAPWSPPSCCDQLCPDSCTYSLYTRISRDQGSHPTNVHSNTYNSEHHRYG